MKIYYNVEDALWDAAKEMKELRERAEAFEQEAEQLRRAYAALEFEAELLEARICDLEAQMGIE